MNQSAACMTLDVDRVAYRRADRHADRITARVARHMCNKGQIDSRSAKMFHKDLQQHGAKTCTAVQRRTESPETQPASLITEPVGYGWPYLACRIGHCVRIRQHAATAPRTCASASLGYSWSYLAHRIGHSVPIRHAKQDTTSLFPHLRHGFAHDDAAIANEQVRATSALHGLHISDACSKSACISGAVGVFTSSGGSEDTGTV
jgi:hypothetical protein